MNGCLTDNDLLKMLANDDQKAFKYIYDKYWKSLYLFVYNIIRSEEIAQDCVQEVFTSLWERRNKVKIRSLEAWLRSAVRFQVLSFVNARKNNREFYQRLAYHIKHTAEEEPFKTKELQAILRKLFVSLPADQQLIFSLSRDQGLNYVQIAQKLNISVKTVEKKISRSLQYLRAHIRSIVLLTFFCVTCF